MLTMNLIPIRKVSSFFPRPPSHQTIWRWTTTGVRGVVLKYVAIGGTRYTSQDWINDFIRQQNSSSNFVMGDE